MGLILSIDVGKGTEDVLIWDRKNNFENAIQLILPSNTQLIKQQIDQLIEQNVEIVIDGEIMAGEPWNRSLYAYAENNSDKVFMSKTSAMSLRYHLPHVESKGINIVDSSMIKKRGLKINVNTKDILWERINDVLSHSGYTKKDVEKVLLCCQDHGNPEHPNQSTRDFRMKTVYNLLKQNGKIEELLRPLNEIEETMPRHMSIGNSAQTYFDHLKAQDIFVMDSSPAVVLGAMKGDDYEIVINVGNGHTIIIGLKDQHVQFAYELHTGGVTASKIEEDIKKIFSHKLTHEESLVSGSHGLFVKEYPDSNKLIDYLPYTLIGPNRQKLTEMDVVQAHPIGNMMMAGPVGMIKAYQNIYLE